MFCVVLYFRHHIIKAGFKLLLSLSRVPSLLEVTKTSPEPLRPSLDSVVMRLGSRLLTLASLVTSEALGLKIQQVSAVSDYKIQTCHGLDLDLGLFSTFPPSKSAALPTICFWLRQGAQ